mmetsp:Transcript_43448/g.69519  ORF Transcript_43448/g.69519 Transcript_43448/m.69519 type:complete len:480 (+) Transcript_43448:64-1503(+)
MMLAHRFARGVSRVARQDVGLVGRRFASRGLSTKLPSGCDILPLPALSPTMEAGNLAGWSIEEGKEYEAGSVICEIETDKATVDYEAVDDGILARILVPAGTPNLVVGTPIAVTAESEEAAALVKDMDLSFLSASPSAPAPAASSPGEETKSAGAAAPVSEYLISPTASFLLHSYGVDVNSVQPSAKTPTGKKIITKGDALRAVSGKSLLPAPAFTPKHVAVPTQAAPAATPVAAAPAASSGEIVNTITESGGQFEDEDLTSMRKVIASRLTEAKQSRPHFYATIDCEIDNILAFRKTLKSQLGKAPSINDMIVRAASLALRDVPRVNCRLEDDGTVVQNESIDVAVAVATPTGLITPIVKNSDKKGVMEISSDMKDLAGRARQNKLKLDEFQGGSFAVSNLGMFGVTDFTAVISPPHSAILAVGGGRQEFNCEGDELKPVNVLTVQISCDRRVIDDLAAGQFLECFQLYMSQPSFMSL